MRLAPFSQPYNRDPAATWRRLLASELPVSYDSNLGLWLITGHDNVLEVLSDTARFSNAATLTPIMPVSAAATAVLAGLDAPPVAVTADPPEHLRTRAILRALFATTAVRAQQQWGELVTDRVDELVADLSGQDSADLMQFAVNLPVQVILDVLGLPIHDATQVRAWTNAMAQLVWGDPSPDMQLNYAHSYVAMWRYCVQAVTDRADGHAHGKGLIGDLLRFRNRTDANLTIAEAASLAFSIVGAGSQTTAGALGHALHYALSEPGRWALLADGEHYLSIHVEEALRHSPAVDSSLRLTTTEVTLDGVTIPAQSRCLVLIGAANHDPAVYSEPRVFDPHRARAGRHLAFGVGPHYCIGAALARLELITALRTLSRRLPNLALAEGYRRQFIPNAALRQHAAMPVRHRPAGRCPVAHGGLPGGAQ